MHTLLRVSFDWEKRQLHGQARLNLRPYFHPTDSVVLDAKGMLIHKVERVSGKTKLADLKYEYDGQKLKIRLDTTFSRFQTFELAIDYTARPEEGDAGGSAAITSAKGLYFINPDGADPDKPRQIWTQGETESSSRWFPTIDAPNERTSQEIYITVDNQYTTLSNGLLVSQTRNEDGTRTDHWKLDIPHAPYLFMMAVGNFVIVRDRWRGIDVDYYVEPEYEDYATMIFGHTPEMLDFFSKRLGVPYPWPKYAQVVVRDFVSGAMENTTATVHMEALQHDARDHLDETHEDYISHELFHQWFGDLVTCESWSNLPLNEAFATYGEILWREHKYGPEDADHHRLQDYLNYMTEAQGKRVPPVRYFYNDKEDMFDSHSYAKGGLILHALRRYLGDEAFFEGLQHYLRKHAYSDVELAELRIALEDVCGLDLNWFFDQWFLGPGHAELEIDYSCDTAAGKVQVAVRQTQSVPENLEVYRLDTHIGLYFPDGRKQTVPVRLVSRDTKYVVSVKEPPAFVDFDPEKIQIAVFRENKPSAYWHAQAKQGEHFLQKYYAYVQLAARADEPAARNVLLAGLKERHWALRKTAIEALNGNMAPAVFDTMMRVAMSDPSAKVRAAALEWFRSLERRPPTDFYKLMLESAVADSSYRVVARGLELMAECDPERVMQVAREAAELKNDDVRFMVATIFLGAAAPEAPTYTENVIRRSKNLYNKIILINNYTEYLKKQPEAIQRRGIAFLQTQTAKHLPTYVRIFAARGLASFQENPEVAEFLRRLTDQEPEGSECKMFFEMLIDP
jgi:aminopeptidase N